MKNCWCYWKIRFGIRWKQDILILSIRSGTIGRFARWAQFLLIQFRSLQLFSSVDPYALVGQWLTDALNPSVYTYEVSPVFILMEEVVLREMRSIVGWPDGNGDGLFSPGGSISNAYAISCARYKFMPDVKVLHLIWFMYYTEVDVFK